MNQDNDNKQEVEVFCVWCNQFIRRVSRKQRTYQEKHGVGYVEFCCYEHQLLWRKRFKDGDAQAKTLTGHKVLKDLRKKKGVDQSVIAKVLGVGQGNYSKLENGKRPITLKMAKRLGEYFRVDFKLFLRGM